MGTDKPPTTILDQIKALRRDLDALAKRPPLTGAVISRGTPTQVRTAGGDVVVELGQVGDVWGLVCRRPDGTVTVQSIVDGDGVGSWGVFDAAGNPLVAPDISGQGLATPYVPMMVLPATSVASPPMSTTSGSFTMLHRVYGIKQHPHVRVLALAVTDVSTSGEMRLEVAGTPISGAEPIPLGDNSLHELECPVTGSHLDDIAVDVMVRRTAGAGAVRVAVASAIGKRT
ncbi:MAG: hypothetical protein EPO06_12010 [Burkholderiaceae bacterium]|nr:MAG: hypothetical protein EPO06_12010 [Burkholderiaceae bacterium]